MGDAARQMEWERLEKKSSDMAVGLLLSPPFYALVAWGIFELVEWATWLYWPVLVVLVVMLMAFVAMPIYQIKLHATRADTAPQKLRSASQGRIELVGTLLPLEGEILSPLYSVPCVAWRSRFTAWAEQRHGQPRPVAPAIDFKESDLPAAVLLSDGEASAFIPLYKSATGLLEVEIDARDEPKELLRMDLRQPVEAGRLNIGDRSEVVIPCGKRMQVNATLITLSSDQSYQQAVRRRLNLPELTPDALEKDAIENAWLSHCRGKEEAAGTPVQVDAIVPTSHVGDLHLAAVRYVGWRETLFILWLCFWASIFISLLLAIMTGMLD